MTNSAKTLCTQSAVNIAVWSICDIMRRSNCARAMQYVPELTWILFLRILDERETREIEEAAAVKADFQPLLAAPYRWQDWAAPDAPKHTGEALETLKRRTFYGREKETLVYPVGLANLMLHGIDKPHIWHGKPRVQVWTTNPIHKVLASSHRPA